MTQGKFFQVPIGDIFFDVVSQERFVKTTETHGKMLVNGNTVAEEFEPDDPVRIENNGEADRTASVSARR